MAGLTTLMIFECAGPEPHNFVVPQTLLAVTQRSLRSVKTAVVSWI